LYRILVINWQDISHPQGGGAEVHLHEIFKRIAAKGHDVTLLCCHYPDAKATETVDGIRIVRRGHRAFFNFEVPGAYRQLLRQENFDIVFDDINKIAFYTPLFVKKPLIGMIHHLFGRSIFKETSILPASYVYGSEALIPWIYRNTPMMVVSPSSQAELIARGMNPDKLEIVYNGVDATQYRPEIAPKSDTPLIGYLGRIKRYKSVQHLIDAMQSVVAEIPAAKLMILGDGDYLPALRQKSQELGLENHVKFTGFIGEADKIKFLNQMWVCVNPSPKEGWGVSVIEANACGTPVIAADSPGLRDSVLDQQTGGLFPYGDIKTLAEKIIALIKQEKLRRELSANARIWAEKFDWEISVQKTLRLIEKTIQ
jgi:glycosyltransferase involved in cell wall biosynthesis